MSIWQHKGSAAAGRRDPPGSRLWRSAAVLATAVSALALAQAPPAGSLLDIPYASVGGKTLRLDLHMPRGVTLPPLLVWVHGGAWRQGSKATYPAGFVANGIAVASIDFRPSTEARFPAMVHDIKAAIRYLRANAARYAYRGDRIAIGGDSSGGHLASLVGVTNGSLELEGSLGDFRQASSSVQAIVDYYGASNLISILAQSTPFGLGVREPALELLLGGPPDRTRALAELASTVRHVDGADPPALIFHGDQDPQMPINQSHELQGAYQRAGVPAEMVVVHGAAHGGDVFYTGENLNRAVAFITRAIGAR